MTEKKTIFAQIYSTDQAIQGTIEIWGLKSIFGFFFECTLFANIFSRDENVPEKCTGLKNYPSWTKFIMKIFAHNVDKIC